MLYSPTVAAEFFIWKSTTRAHDRRTEKHFIFKPGFLKVNHAHNKHIFTIFANQRHTIPAKKTINIKTKENEELVIEGRHDPCIDQRAIPVIECIAAIGILDLMKEV